MGISRVFTVPSKRRIFVLLIVLFLVTAGGFVLRAVTPGFDFARFEKRVFSQNGEDGIIEKVFESIEPTSKYCVEFGGGDGATLSNVRNLIQNHGWSSLLMEGDKELVKKCQSLYKDRTNVKCAHHWV